MHINRFPLIALAATAVWPERRSSPPQKARQVRRHHGRRDHRPHRCLVRRRRPTAGAGGTLRRGGQPPPRAAALQIEISYDTDDTGRSATPMASSTCSVRRPAHGHDGRRHVRAAYVPFLVNDDDQADRVAASPAGRRDDGRPRRDRLDRLAVRAGVRNAPRIAGSEPLRTMTHSTGMRIACRRARDRGDLRRTRCDTEDDLENDAWAWAMADGSSRAYEFPTVLWRPDSTMAANFALYYEFVVLSPGTNRSPGSIDAREQSLTRRRRQPSSGRWTSACGNRGLLPSACANGATLTAMPITLEADIGRAVDDVIIGLLEDPATRATVRPDQTGGRSEAMGTWPDECRDGDTNRYATAASAVGDVPARALPGPRTGPRAPPRQRRRQRHDDVFMRSLFDVVVTMTTTWSLAFLHELPTMRSGCDGLGSIRLSGCRCWPGVGGCRDPVWGCVLLSVKTTVAAEICVVELGLGNSTCAGSVGDLRGPSDCLILEFYP